MTPMPMHRGRLAPLAAAITASILGLGASPSLDASTAPDRAETGPAVVLRMDVGGGFAPFQVSLTNVPVFTLYDDGRVIFQSDGEVSPSGPLAPMRTTTMPPPLWYDLV